MECPVVKLSGFCVRSCAPQASTLSPSEPPLDTFLPSSRSLLWNPSLQAFPFCCFCTIFSLTSSTWKIYLICFSLHFDLATAHFTSWKVCPHVFPNIPHSLKVLCKRSPCLPVASESLSQAVWFPHSSLKTNLSQVTSYSVVTAESGKNTGLGLDLNLNPRSAPMGLLDFC